MVEPVDFEQLIAQAMAEPGRQAMRPVHQARDMIDWLPGIIAGSCHSHYVRRLQ